MQRKPFQQLNIRTRLLFLCLAVAMPLVAISAYSIWKQYQTLNNEARHATTFQAALAVRALSHWITAQEDGLRSLAAQSAIERGDPWAARHILATANQAQADWHSVHLVDNSGQFIASSNGETLMAPGELARQPFFKQVLATGKPALSGYLNCPTSGQPALLAGCPVLAKKSVREVVVACIDPRAVLKLFQGLGGETGSVIAVVDQNKRLVARTLMNEQWVGHDWSNAKTVRAASHAWRGTLEAVGIADPTQRTYAFDRVPGHDWLVIVGVPTAVLYGAAHDWLSLMGILACCAVVVSVVLAYEATGHFTRPLSRVVREALAIGRGDLSKRVEIADGGEIGLLARAFNQMAERLEMSQEHKLLVEHISQSIRQSLDLDQVLNTTVRELGQALQASRCCFALVDARSPDDLACDQLVFDYSWWDETRAGGPLKNRCVLVTENSLLKVLLAQGSVLSFDLLEAGKQAPLFENSGSYPDDWQSIKSIVACPISSHDRPLGLILVHQCDGRRSFSDSELELVQDIADHVALAMEHAGLYEQTKTLAEQELLINHIVRSVRGSLDLDTILNTVTRELGEALDADRCQIGQPRIEGPLVVSHEFHAESLLPMRGVSIYGHKLDFHPAEIGEPGFKTVLGIDLSVLKDPGEDVGETTLRDAPIAVMSDVASDERALAFREFTETVGTRSLIAAPLLDKNRLLGVLIVHQCTQSRQWRAAEISLVAAIADHVAVAISHAQLFAQVKHQAITDGLTGLYNHVYLKNRLIEQVRVADRKGTPLSLLMIDLDKLKTINDTFGHPVGDAAIRQVGWTLKNLLRSGDTAARYGGEEFAVILPETSLSEAALIADRLCRQVNNKPVPGLGTVSVSIGAATFPTQAATSEELFKRADIALYEAKHGGRNRVCLYKSARTNDQARDKTATRG